MENISIESLEDPTGSDVCWFAIDKNEYIAMFSSNGWGPVPIVSLQNEEKIGELIDYIIEFKEVRNFNALFNLECIDNSYLDVVKRGIFYFDYDESTKDGNYVLVAYPTAPMIISQLLLEQQVLLSKVSLQEICFTGSNRIKPENYIKCIYTTSKI